MLLTTDLGVTHGQGFLLGEPEPLAEQLDNLISARSGRRKSAPDTGPGRPCPEKVATDSLAD